MTLATDILGTPRDRPELWDRCRHRACRTRLSALRSSATARRASHTAASLDPLRRWSRERKRWRVGLSSCSPRHWFRLARHSSSRLALTASEAVALSRLAPCPIGGNVAGMFFQEQCRQTIRFTLPDFSAPLHVSLRDFFPKICDAAGSINVNTDGLFLLALQESEGPT